MSARTWFGLAAVILALGVTVVALRTRTPPEAPGYPEYQALAATELRRAREALGPADRQAHYRPDEPGQDVGAALEGSAPLAVVAVLHERAGEPTGAIEFGPCFADEHRRPVGAWLARQRDATLNAVLLRIATDERLEFDLRDNALVALCWEGNVDALPGLTALALDMHAAHTIRDRTLTRIPRIGARPGKAFESLLYLPFRGHDAYAAAILALAGKPVAPSLVLDGLRHRRDNAGDLEHLLARAAVWISEGDPEVSQKARVAERAIEASWGFGAPSEISNAQALADLTDALGRWRTAHPEVHPSRFELERLAYRHGSRYQLERRVLEAADPTSIPEAEIDFAAAALRITDAEGRWLDRPLDALDRMSLLLGDEMRTAKDPLAKLRVLHARLLPSHVMISSYIETGPSTFLDTVLRERAGNCVGLTSLYVALGERLDLPLVAVSIPGHVFLRWNDGLVVHDIELTDRGRTRSQEDLEGATPRVLTKRGLLSVVLSNRSGVCLDSPWLKDEGRLEPALRFADEALRYDAGNYSAHLARARCMARLGNAEEALRSAERAVEMEPSDVRAPLVAGESLLLLQRPEEALTWFDRARALDDRSADPLLGRLACLTTLDRDDQVVAEAGAFLEREDQRDIRLLRLRALVKLGRRGWEAELDDLAPEPPQSWTLRTSIARLLLERGATDAVLRVLSPLLSPAGDLAEAVRQADGREDESRVFVTVRGGGGLGVKAGTVRSLLAEAQALQTEARSSNASSD